MKTSKLFESPEKFAAHLHKLCSDRMNEKQGFRDQVTRKAPSAALREEILAKTAGMCHICGDKLEDSWHADHISHHSKRGPHEVANYLPAHPQCNSSRKGFDPEEIQWIMKLGVWLRTQIQNETDLGKNAAVKFLAHERTRHSRRKS